MYKHSVFFSLDAKNNRFIIQTNDNRQKKMKNDGFLFHSQKKEEDITIIQMNDLGE